MFADIAGWGSTIDIGPKPFRQIPVEIVAPGNVDSVNIDKFFFLLISTLL